MRVQNLNYYKFIKSLISSGRFAVLAMSLALVTFLAACTTDDTSSDIIVTDTTAPTLTDGSCPTTVASAVDGVFTWTDPTYADETDAATDLVIMVTALVGEETTTIEDADANTEGFQYTFEDDVTTVTVTYTAMDDAGNANAECTFDVTITLVPAIVLTANTCPADITQEYDSSGSDTTAEITWTAPTYTLANVDSSEAPVVTATAAVNGADATDIENAAGTDGTVTYTASMGSTVVTYTATSTSVTDGPELETCTFTITVRARVFEFPTMSAEVVATADGTDISDSNAFTCAETRWGFGHFTCTNNPEIDFSTYMPTQGGTTTVYEKVEIEIIHTTYQEESSGELMKCDGSDDYAGDLCPISIIATSEMQDSAQRELGKTNSSIELMRYVPNYGIATGTDAADRTLREDITHLWPYLQGQKIYLSMNNAFSSNGGAPMIEGLKVILTPYGDDTTAAPTPGDGTSLPYKVAPAFGNGINQESGQGVNNRHFLFQNDITTGTSLLGGTGALMVPTNTVTAADLTNMSELGVYLYATGRRVYNQTGSTTLPLTFLLGTNTNAADANIVTLGTQDIYQIEIPAGDSTDYNRVLPKDADLSAPTGQLDSSALPGWRPGQRVPYFDYSESINDLSGLSLTENSELYLNVTTTATAITEEDDIGNYLLMLAGSYVFYRDY